MPKKSNAKGGDFERDMSKLLSMWWTNDERDDVIWRTQLSGGRATFRSQKNKTTEGQHGDLTYTDPCAKPLFDVCVIETKRGYGRWGVLDLIDKIGKINNPKEQILERWLDKAEEDRDAAGVRYVLLIVKRDRRQAIVFFSRMMASSIRGWYGPIPKPFLTIRREDEDDDNRIDRHYCAMPLKAFLDWCQPQFFQKGEIDGK